MRFVVTKLPPCLLWNSSSGYCVFFFLLNTAFGVWSLYIYSNVHESCSRYCISHYINQWHMHTHTPTWIIHLCNVFGCIVICVVCYLVVVWYHYSPQWWYHVHVSIHSEPLTISCTLVIYLFVNRPSMISYHIHAFYACNQFMACGCVALIESYQKPSVNQVTICIRVNLWRRVYQVHASLCTARVLCAAMTHWMGCWIDSILAACCASVWQLCGFVSLIGIAATGLAWALSSANNCVCRPYIDGFILFGFLFPRFHLMCYCYCCCCCV